MNSDSELTSLMMASIAGDDAAHRRLLTALSGRLRSYYRSRLSRLSRGDREAEDLVQEALIAIHTRRHTFDTGQQLMPWVYAIARYKLIDHLRRTKASKADVPIEYASDVMAADDRESAESAFDLNNLLARLPEKVRLAIQYVKLDGLSVAETAARCKISESSVKINIHRGLKVLARSMAKESGSCKQMT